MDTEGNIELRVIQICSPVSDVIEPVQKDEDNHVDVNITKEKSKSSGDSYKVVGKWILCISLALIFVVTAIVTTMYLLRIIGDLKLVKSEISEIVNVQKQFKFEFSEIFRNFQKQLKSEFSEIADKVDIINVNVDKLKVKGLCSNLNGSQTTEVEDSLQCYEVVKRNVIGLCSNVKGCETTEIADSYQCYIFVKQSVTWHEALSRCNSYGGFLAEVHDIATLNYLNKIFSETNLSYWLGGSDENHEGMWKWVTSGKYIDMSVSDWGPKDPNNAGGGEDYLVVGLDGEWLDQNDKNMANYVCQKNADTCEGWLF